MKKALKTKWVKALRSGKFKQTTGQLCNTGIFDPDKPGPSYCCLGVLAEIQGDLIDTGEEHKRLGKAQQPGLLTPHFRKKYGIEKPTMHTLANLNDTGTEDGEHREDASPWSFKKIANWIEKNL